MGIGEIIALIKSLGGGGGGSVPKPLTYDYMPEGYPSKSGWSIEWDGNTEGLVSASDTFFKVSDLLPTNDELIGSTVERSDGEKIEITSNLVDVLSEDVTVVVAVDWPVVAVVKKDTVTIDEVTFPQKGTYFVWIPEVYTTKLSKQTITPIAEEFLPLSKPLTYDYMPEGYPSKSGWSIEWNGNTTGLVSVDVNGSMCYKVSDLLPTNDELIGSTVERSDGEKIEITSNLVDVVSEDVTVVAVDAIIAKKDNATFEESTFPQKGTYFVWIQEVYTTKLSKQTITPMAEEFMPVLTSPNGTKYKLTVDDTGTLSATEVT